VNDPIRLLHDAPNDLEAELLRSVASERPTFEHRARVRQAMGLTPGGSIAPPAASLGAGKIALAGLIAAGAIAALLAHGTSRRDTAAPSGTAVEMVAAPAPTPVPIADEPPAPVALSQVLPSAGAPPSPIPRATAIIPSRPARDSKNLASESATTSSIQDQIALIDTAHAAVKRHDTGAALAAVDAYASKYPGGLFAEEAAVIRIEAIDQNGSHARATSLAKAFLAKHPTSPHAKRLERIAGN
jgi:hypothetical protein